jgi:transcriptional regulator GlxA family with amidase domain
MSPELIDPVRRLARRSDRIGSICTGAFILAGTGLLANRPAVTHWGSVERLQALHPDVIVEVDPIFLKDGNVWTSAGVTSGIDLALAMVAEDLGRQAALSLVRRLVMYMVRPSGQAQFSTMLHVQNADTSGRFEELHAWMLEHLDTDLIPKCFPSMIKIQLSIPFL